VRDGLSPPAGLLLNLVAGFGLVAAGAAGFAQIAEQLGPGRTIARADDALEAAIGAHVAAATLHAFALVTQLGDAQVLTTLGAVVAIGLCWRRQRSLALAWVLALAGNALLSPTLKRIFERCGRCTNTASSAKPAGVSRAATPGRDGRLRHAGARGDPHAAAALWHLPAVLGATALAYTVGSSRVFLQVHFVSDVAAGFASGGAWLMVCVISIG
jgi:membrane-associated phospholipid phosphatase